MKKHQLLSLAAKITEKMEFISIKINKTCRIKFNSNLVFNIEVLN